MLWEKARGWSQSFVVWIVCGAAIAALLVGRSVLVQLLPAVPRAAISQQENAVLQREPEQEQEREAPPPAIEQVQPEEEVIAVSEVIAPIAPFDPTKAVMPVQGEVVRIPGWYRHPEYGDWRLSPGIEIKPLQPGQKVVSSYGGVVAQVSKSRTGGWDVVLTHQGDWSSEYRGLEEVVVEPQQAVSQGSLLGTSLRDDEAAIAFVLRRGEGWVDPGKYLSQQ
jgi:murein DD-endopeptidase MepM/ murein hydrolase activator NlpD